jgi:hypothetical protein
MVIIKSQALIGYEAPAYRLPAGRQGRQAFRYSVKGNVSCIHYDYLISNTNNVTFIPLESLM